MASNEEVRDLTTDGSVVVLAEGYTQQRHWEIVYHDLVDLYGPKIGMDGIGLWVAYKRFVQNSPGHALAGMAWPSQRKILAPLFRASQSSVARVREALADAGLITVYTGKELAAMTQAEYDEQVAIAQVDGKPRRAVRRITLGDLAAIGIRNPARTLLVEVHDPLSFHGFCELFDLRYYPHVTGYDGDGGQVWNILFEDYPGIIRGTNRILAAVRYLSENLDAGGGSYWPLADEWQICSLLRCRPDDEETIAVREQLLARRAKLTTEGVESPEPVDVATTAPSEA